MFDMFIVAIILTMIFGILLATSMVVQAQLAKSKVMLDKLPPHVQGALKDIVQNGKDIQCKVVWKACQWESTDGEIHELEEMFHWHGTPGAVEIFEGFPE